MHIQGIAELDPADMCVGEEVEGVFNHKMKYEICIINSLINKLLLFFVSK